MVYNIIMSAESFKNTYVEDVLCAEEVEDLSNIVEHYLNTLEITENEYEKGSLEPVKILRKMMGRIAIQNLPLPDSCLKAFTSLISESGFEGYTYASNTTYLEYKNQYGIPKLPSHRDGEGPDSVIIDYCLMTNIKWPIVIDNNSFTLKENSAVLFDGVNQYHSRAPKKLEDNDFEKVILVKFTKENK